jgi:hypothetical protein
MRPSVTIGIGVAVSIGATIAAIRAPMQTVLAIAAVAVLVGMLSVPRDKVATVGAIGGLVVTVALPASDFSGTFRLALSFIAAILMLLGFARSSVRRTVRGQAWLMVVWLLLLGIGGQSQEDLAKWLAFAVLMAAGLLVATRANATTVMRAFVVLAGVQAAIALAQVFAGLTLPWPTMTTMTANELLGAGALRASGTLGHALPLTFLLVVTFAILLRDRAWLPGAVRILVYVALIGGVAAAGSRSGALILAGLVLFVSGRKLTVVRAIVGALFALLGLLLVVRAGFFQSETFARLIDSGSVTHRQGALDAVSRLINDQPVVSVLFGNGRTGVTTAFAEGLLQQDRFNAVDNQFVTLLVTVGVIGTLAVVILLLTAIRRADTVQRWALLAAVAMFVIFDVLLWNSSALIVVLLTGFALSNEVKPGAPGLSRRRTLSVSSRR